MPTFSNQTLQQMLDFQTSNTEQTDSNADQKSFTSSASSAVLESPFDVYGQGIIGGNQLLYKAKPCDEIDWMMAKFFNSDPVGKKSQLPVVRIDKGVYLVGLCKWDIKINDSFRLVVKGNNSWSSFK